LLPPLKQYPSDNVEFHPESRQVIAATVDGSWHPDITGLATKPPFERD
jgi:hypothetical protein